MQKSDANFKNGNALNRIRAFRHQNPDQQLELGRLKLGMGAEFTALDPTHPYRLLRALRMARRAANGGMRDYDPVRHLLLARYLKSLKLAETKTESGKNNEKEPSAREDVYDRGLVGA